MKTNPDFGKPSDAYEQVAHDFLAIYCGQEGPAVMQALAATLRAAVTTERKRCADIVRSIGGDNREHVATAIDMGAEMTGTRSAF